MVLRGSLSRIALTDSIGLTGSGITRLLAPMTRKNIVLKTANSRDARQSLVGLTSTGKAVYIDALHSFKHSCRSIFSLLEDSEVALLLKLLKKIKC